MYCAHDYRLQRKSGGISSGWLLGWFLLDLAPIHGFSRLVLAPPGVLAFLNGCDLRAALRGQVLLAKMFGTILAVGGGLALGPEGHESGRPISRSSAFDYSIRICCLLFEYVLKKSWRSSSGAWESTNLNIQFFFWVFVRSSG